MASVAPTRALPSVTPSTRLPSRRRAARLASDTAYPCTASLRVFENVETAGRLPPTERRAATFAVIDRSVTDRHHVVPVSIAL